MKNLPHDYNLRSIYFYDSQQLQKESEEQIVLENESAQTFTYLCQQVSALQRGFTSLADAVLEELDAVREESVRFGPVHLNFTSIRMKFNRFFLS